MSKFRKGEDHDGDGDLAVEKKKKTKRPSRWKVLMHNDDYTTTDFVVDMLVRYFHKAPAEAIHVMLQIHHKGLAVAGVYDRDVAETKIQEVSDEARAQGMPLLLTTERE